jgi:GLPGLI family protein
MKNLMKILLAFAVIGMIMTSNSYAKGFKGIITYKISYPDMDLDPSAQAMMPKMMTFKIRENLGKTEIDIAGMMKQIQIIDGENKIVYSLMEMMGQKFYFEMTEEEIKKEMEEEKIKSSVEIVDETKEIAGYKCKKAIITVEQEGDENTFVVYFTKELGTKDLNFDNNVFKDIDGVMLEFEINEGNMSMKLEAVSVDKKNVPMSEFEIPEDYEKTTKEELREKLGGGF